MSAERKMSHCVEQLEAPTSHLHHGQNRIALADAAISGDLIKTSHFGFVGRSVGTDGKYPG